MLFSGRLDKMIRDLCREMADTQKDLAAFKRHVLTDLENMRRTVKDLILFVEDSGETDASKTCRMTESWRDDLSEDVRILREQTARLLAMQNQGKAVSEPPRSEVDEDRIAMLASAIHELRESWARPPAFNDHPDSVRRDSDVAESTGDIRRFLEELKQARKETALLRRQLEVIVARTDGETSPDADAIQCIRSEFEKVTQDMTTAIRNEAREIQEALKDAKNDINARITYAVARLKS